MNIHSRIDSNKAILVIQFNVLVVLLFVMSSVYISTLSPYFLVCHVMVAG